MKKFFILFCSLLLGIVSFAFTQSIDEKLLQAFKSSFPKAEEVNWFESKETWVVSFRENGIRTRAEFKKDGQLRTLSRAYDGTNLPYSIQFRIKQEYPGKQIFGVVETITTERNSSATAYNIKLEDEKYWYTVQMDNDGSTTVIEKFRKSR